MTEVIKSPVLLVHPLLVFTPSLIWADRQSTGRDENETFRKDVQRRLCSIVEFCSPPLAVLNVAWFGQICDEGHHHAHVDPRPNGDGESS